MPEIELPAYQVDFFEAFGRERGITPGEVLGRWVRFLDKNQWMLEPFYMNMPLSDWPPEKFKIFSDFMTQEMNR